MREPPGTHNPAGRIRPTAAFALIVALCAALYGFGQTMGHPFDQAQCPKCHVTVPQKNEPGPHEFAGPINGLCLACHVGLESVSHKLCVKPSVKLAESMPLEEGCGVTCATCHDPHMARFEPDTGEKTNLLRKGAAGFWHCGICHRSDLSKSEAVTHRPSMDRVHGYAHFKVVKGEPGLDPLTLLCLSCHGRPGEDEPTSPGSEVWEHGTNEFIPHGVGMDYEAAAWVDPNLKLADRDRALPLFDGKVGCCTCHDPYMPGGGLQLRLGANGDRSLLCLGCHIER